MWRASFGWLGVLLCCLVSCDGPPEKRETIRELRVLAVKAEPPEVKPGEKVSLSVLAVQYPSEKIRVSWYACKSPSDVQAGCHTSGAGQRFGDKDAVELVIPKEYLDGATAKDAFNGKYFVVSLVLSTGAQTVYATKRIVVSTNPTNQNPTLEQLALLDGETPLQTPFELDVKKQYTLQPKVADGVRQSYPILDPSGAKKEVREKLYYSWYTTQGEFSKGYLTQDGAVDNTWQLPAAVPDDKAAKLFLILRDGRGGVDWKVVDVALK